VVAAARTVPAFPGSSPCRFIAADIATADGVAALAGQTLELLGGIDILVSNAGSQTHRPEGVLAFSDEDWQRDLDTNLMSAVRLDRALLPAMIAQDACLRGQFPEPSGHVVRVPRRSVALGEDQVVAGPGFADEHALQLLRLAVPAD
jgi:NAD(P)-dependent dehydrogenase (short-subunit alcohol dehydrogenase family)